jgi:hypothetical protein
MKRIHPAFWAAGWAGLVVGGLLAVIGFMGNTEIARLAGGYGMLLAGSGLYLLAGLRLRRTLARRARLAQVTRTAPHTATIGTGIPASPRS